jgi:hypothetical protein
VACHEKRGYELLCFDVVLIIMVLVLITITRGGSVGAGLLVATADIP